MQKWCSNPLKSQLQLYVTGHYAFAIAVPCIYQLLIEPDFVRINGQMIWAVQDYFANL